MCTLLFFQRVYGGPLVCQEHERKVIIGVSIQRTKCASSQPALFVNVAFYSEWIYKVFKLYPSLERKWWFGVKRNGGLYHCLQEKGQLGPNKNQRPLQRESGNEETKNLTENGHFDIWRIVSGDWMFQIGFHHFANEEILVVSINTIFTTKSWAHGWCANSILKCSELLKPCKQSKKDTYDSVLSPGMYLNLNPSLKGFPFFFFVCFELD